jgi:hypothetical protein
MSTIRQQIVEAVLVRLRQINPATVVSGSAGYYVTEAGTNVFEWRDLTKMPFDGSSASDLEAMSLKDFEELGSQEITNWHEKELKLQLDFASNKDSDTESAAEHGRKIIGDIEKCIGVDRKWAGLALDTVPPEKNEMQVVQSGRVIVNGTVTFSIKYRNRSFDPYTQ